MKKCFTLLFVLLSVAAFVNAQTTPIARPVGVSAVVGETMTFTLGVSSVTIPTLPRPSDDVVYYAAAFAANANMEFASGTAQVSVKATPLVNGANQMGPSVFLRTKGTGDFSRAEGGIGDSDAQFVEFATQGAKTGTISIGWQNSGTPLPGTWTSTVTYTLAKI